MDVDAGMNAGVDVCVDVCVGVCVDVCVDLCVDAFVHILVKFSIKVLKKSIVYFLPFVSLKKYVCDVLVEPNRNPVSSSLFK